MEGRHFTVFAFFVAGSILLFFTLNPVHKEIHSLPLEEQITPPTNTCKETPPTALVSTTPALHAKKVFSHQELNTLLQELREEGAKLEKLEGYGLVAYEALIKQAMITYYDVKIVCEIGFNAGHSAAMWLSTSQELKLYSFDICEHKYVFPNAARIKQVFGEDRMELICGNSLDTIPNFAPNDTGFSGCDLMHIDGWHYADVPLKDLLNFRKIARESGPKIVIMDDCTCSYDWCTSPTKAWETAVNASYIDPLVSVTYFNWVTHAFCYGQYNEATASAGKSILEKFLAT